MQHWWGWACRALAATGSCWAGVTCPCPLPTPPGGPPAEGARAEVESRIPRGRAGTGFWLHLSLSSVQTPWAGRAGPRRAVPGLARMRDLHQGSAAAEKRAGTLRREGAARHVQMGSGGGEVTEAR